MKNKKIDKKISIMAKILSLGKAGTGTYFEYYMAIYDLYELWGKVVIRYMYKNFIMYKKDYSMLFFDFQIFYKFYEYVKLMDRKSSIEKINNKWYLVSEHKENQYDFII